MSFGRPSGPPASAAQIRELLQRLHEAGHSDFRDARGPMGFTQRQAAGKFTRDEAAEFIEQLQTQAHDRPEAGEPVPSSRLSPSERALRGASSEDLAAELQRRGWIVVQP